MRLTLRPILAAIALSLSATGAIAQALPSPQVQTRSANDNSARAASTSYVDGALSTLNGNTTASPNKMTVRNNATGYAPSLTPIGPDTNINIDLNPKGTGQIWANGPLQAPQSFTTPHFYLNGASGSLTLGNQTTPSFGGAMRTDWTLDDGVNPISATGGIWPTGKTYCWFCVGRTFDATTIASPGNTPFASTLSKATNAGTSAEVVGMLSVANAAASGAAVYGANLIAMSNPSLTAPKLIGLEVDVQPASGVTPSSDSTGVFINAFNSPIPGSAIQIGSGGGGGTFGNGIGIGGIATTGSGLYGISGTTMGSLINTGGATYVNNSAVVMNQGHFIQFGTASTRRMGLDSSSNLHIPVPNSVVFRSDNDDATLMSVAWTGDVTVTKLAGANGAGNAYVCVNESGQLFRSNSACR